MREAITKEQAERESKMDCRETDPHFSGRDLEFLRCQIGEVFSHDPKTGAPRFRLVAFGHSWQAALDHLRKTKQTPCK